MYMYKECKVLTTPEQNKVMFTDEHYDEDGIHTGTEMSTLLTKAEKEKVEHVIEDYLEL